MVILPEPLNTWRCRDCQKVYDTEDEAEACEVFHKSFEDCKAAIREVGGTWERDSGGHESAWLDVTVGKAKHRVYRPYQADIPLNTWREAARWALEVAERSKITPVATLDCPNCGHPIEQQPAG